MDTIQEQSDHEINEPLPGVSIEPPQVQKKRFVRSLSRSSMFLHRSKIQERVSLNLEPVSSLTTSCDSSYNTLSESDERSSTKSSPSSKPSSPKSLTPTPPESPSAPVTPPRKLSHSDLPTSSANKMKRRTTSFGRGTFKMRHDKEKSPREESQTSYLYVHMIDKTVVFKEFQNDVTLQEILDDIASQNATVVTDSTGTVLSPSRELNELRDIFYYPKMHNTQGLSNIIFFDSGHCAVRIRFFHQRGRSSWVLIDEFLDDLSKLQSSALKAFVKKKTKPQEEAQQTLVKKLVSCYPDHSKVVFDSSGDEPKILSANIDTLIEILTHPLGFDKKIALDFIMSFEMSITASQLLEKIIDRFKSSTDPVVHKSCVSFLREWATRRQQVFIDNQSLMQSLSEFASTEAEKNQQDTHLMGLHLYLKALFDGAHAKQTLDIENALATDDQANAPKPETLPFYAQIPIDLLDIHPIELARQMTLIDFHLFKKIKLSEYVVKDPSQSPNIAPFIQRFNKMHLWISTLICLSETPERRSLWIRYFIQVAVAALFLNNFVAVLEVVSALNSAPIQRLLQTWADVPKRSLQQLEMIKNVVTFEHSYRTLRNHLACCEEAAVPYLGMYIQDLLFIQEANNDLTDGMVNFAKHNMLTRPLVDINKFLMSRYQLQPVPEIQAFLQLNHVLPEDVIYEESLARESKEANAKLKLKRDKR